MANSINSTTNTENNSNNSKSSTRSISTNKGSKSSSSIISIILILLLLVALFRELRGLPPITFSGFLEFLQGVPDVSTSWATAVDLTIYGNWEFFDFFRVFLNMFTDVFELLVLVAGGLVQTFTFIFYFLHYLFGF